MFQKARLKLTAWYLVIITVICFMLSLVIFRIQMSEVGRFAKAQRIRIERQYINKEFFPPEPPQIDPELIEETQKRLLENLLILNGVIIIISGGFGYLLAGKTLNPIKDMVDEQDRFISDSSHEFRTPLTSLKSSMEVALMDKKLRLEDARKLIAENIEDVNRLQKLSDSLIQLTRKNSKQGLKIGSIDSKKIIENATKQIKGQAEKKHIQIKTSVKNVKFQGDEEKLTNLLVIFLENAIKYSPKNKSVSVKTWKTKQCVHFSVKDRGIGINQKDLPHIFDRFFRADTSRSSLKTSGHGLGLSIAKMIIDQHKGSVSVKSDEKKGSVFSIRFPLKLV